MSVNAQVNGSLGISYPAVDPSSLMASSPSDLLHDAVVCGSGEPSHNPQRTAQIYINTANGAIYYWYSGQWTTV